MLKIIELDIESALSADTGVWEVAWVEMPAIEQDLIFFGRQKFYKATDEVSRVACQAIKENEERGNPAATQVGKVRAQQLCKRDEISLETVKRMYSYLERAKVYNTDNWDDNGTISWKLWGGQPALDWTKRILDSLERKEEMAENPITRIPKEERGKTGSEKNKPGDTENTRGGIEVSDEVEKTLKEKVKEHNEKNTQESQKADLGMLKAVWRRGAGAYSVGTPGRRGMTRNQWAMGRVNAFLRILGGSSPSDKDYKQDNDLLPKSHPKHSEEKMAKQDFVYPTGGESESEFISRCVPYLMNEGKTQDEALGACYGMWKQEFDYDTSALPSYDNYPPSGDTNAMLVKPFLMEEDCGCSQQFNIIGYIDGQPIYKTREEAEEIAKQMGCDGSHEHEDENGNIVYMPCDVHPTIGPKGGNVIGDANIKSVGSEQNIEIFSAQDYSKEELEAVEYLHFLKQTHKEEFERVVGSLRGVSSAEIKRRNHKTPTTYFRYERVASGREPGREFCDSIQGQFFRRIEIDLLRPLNVQFGHNQEPYSKWLWKGGPNCVHAWVEYEAKGDSLVMKGPVAGTPGTAPKNMPNNGYYSAETKRKSTVAYIISQQNMSKQNIELVGELLPDLYTDDIPLYYDPLVAADASYLLGCGGITEEIVMSGNRMYMACSSNMKKVETEKQIFKAEAERKMIYTPLMIPNILIPRLDEITGEKYFVKFTPETIQKIQQKFMTEQRLRETNLEHSEIKFKDIVMVESWIVGAGQDKAYTLGFTKQQIPFGTWMAGYKVLDTDEGNKVWDDFIKPGKVKGASVEGNFILNFSQEKTDEYLLNEIINVIKQIN